MPNGWYRVPMLTYHRIGAHRRGDLLTVSPQTLERQLAFLRRRRYRVLGLDELMAIHDAKAALPPRSVVITFDDNYDGTHRLAWPLLKRYRCSATVFVATAEVGLPGNMTWEQIAELAHEGMTIGSHTMHHSYLPALTGDQVLKELTESKRIIEEHIGQVVHFLSYPIGGFTPQVQVTAQQVGYRAACTTNRASSSNGYDRYALRRIKITERDQSLLFFWAKTSGYYDLFRQRKASA